MRISAILPVLVVLLLISSCQSVMPEAPTPIPADAPEPRGETSPGKELTIETWEIGDNWTYSSQAIWGDVLVGLEYELERGIRVKQYITTYNLRTREKELVYKLPPGRLTEKAPAVYGSRVVWASVDRDEAERQRSIRGAPMPNWDVFLLDLDSGDIQQITSETNAQICPVIYGDTVVWLDTRHVEEGQRLLGYHIYAYDIISKQEKRITSAPTVSSWDLGISGNLVVWQDNRHVEPRRGKHPPEAPDDNEIYLYDLAAGWEQRITNNKANDASPIISGNTIAWIRQPAFREADIFVYNLETGKEKQISRSGYAISQFAPSYYEGRIVWTDARSSLGNAASDTVINGRQGQTDIYLYDLETRQETKLTSTVPGKVMQSPIIYGDYVVYQWVGFPGYMVYGVKLTSEE